MARKLANTYIVYGYGNRYLSIHELFPDCDLKYAMYKAGTRFASAWTRTHTQQLGRDEVEEEKSKGKRSVLYAYSLPLHAILFVEERLHSRESVLFRSSPISYAFPHYYASTLASFTSREQKLISGHIANYESLLSRSSETIRGTSLSVRNSIRLWLWS